MAPAGATTLAHICGSILIVIFSNLQRRRHMGWETQGRQDHGWFGHGTGPGSPATPSDRTGRSADTGTLDQRIGALVGSLLGHFSPADRKHAALRAEGPAAAHIVKAMRVWIGAARLGGDALANALPGTTSDKVKSLLRDTALLTLDAHDVASLNKAGAALASAVSVMGLDRWGRFAAMAAQTAEAAMAASPALRGAVVGAGEGAAAGAETGPGMVVTAAAGGLIGAGIGYLASRPRPDLFTNPGPPAGRKALPTPAQIGPNGAAGTGTPPLTKVPQNLGFPGARSSPPNTVSTPADAPQIGTVLEARQVSPEEEAKRRAIIKGKGLPTEGEMPYVPPKSWTSSQPLPRGPQDGHMDADGYEWVRPKGLKSGTPHWDV